MRLRLRKTKVRIGAKAISYIFAVLMVTFIYGILNTSAAIAEDVVPQDQGGTGNNNAVSSASSEVIPTGTSVVPTQGPLAEASTAVATAESVVTTQETKVAWAIK